MVGGQRHAPASLPLGRAQYPLYRRLGGFQGRSGRVRKIPPPPAFDSRTVQPVASCYTDCVIAAHLTTEIRSEKCVVRRFRRCTNVMNCTDTNLETWHWLCLVMDESPFRHPFLDWGGFHIENLLWQVIFLHNQLIYIFQKFLPPSCMRSVVDRNVVMRSMAV